MAPKSILVTGGAGFIGSHVVERLLAHGDSVVTVLDDFNDLYDPALKRKNLIGVCDHPNFRLVEGDILDEPLVDAIFESVRVDAVIHLAARAGVRPSVEEPLLCQRVNVEGTYRLLDMARRYGVKRFVFASSGAVYGERTAAPSIETDPVPFPTSPYAATKIAAEAACHVFASLYGIQTICLRLFAVYGPRQRPDVAMHTFARRLGRGAPAPVFGDGTAARDLMYISDAVDCIESALGYDATPYEIVNVGSGSAVGANRLVELLATALDVKPAIDYQPEPPGVILETCANVEKARRLFGYEPKVSIEDGVERFVEWYIGNERAKTRTAHGSPGAI